MRIRATHAKFGLDLVVTIAVLFATALVISLYWPRRNQVVLPEEPVSIEGLATRGNGTAPVVLVEYADFQCPSCGGIFRTTMPRVERRYVETGLVRIVFRHLPLPQHEFAWPAATAAECAGREGRFWDMHDLMFKNQRTLTDANLVEWASQLGLESSQFRKCLNDDQVSKRIEADMDSAVALRISSTPTLIVGRMQPDGRVKLIEQTSSSFADLQAALDRALATGEGTGTHANLLFYGVSIGGVAVAGSAWWRVRLRRARRRVAAA